MNSLWCDIQGLAASCAIGIGGGRQLFLIRNQDVVYIPPCHHSGHIVLGAIQIRPDTGFLQYHLLVDSLKFEETPEQTVHGLLYRYRITGRDRRMRPTSSDELRRLVNGHFIAIFKDFNGEVLLVGTKDSPLRLQHRATSGDQRASKNEYEWILEGTGSAPACFMDATIEPPNEVGDPCSDLSNEDFDITWVIEDDDTLTGIELSAAAAGNISTIGSYPYGTLFNEAGTAVDVLEWNATESRYEPSSGTGIHVVNGVWTMEVELIPLTLVNPAAFNCSYTLRDSIQHTATSLRDHDDDHDTDYN